MVREQVTETAEGLGWAQDQIYQLKARAGQVEQQLTQLQSLVTQMGDGVRAADSSLREASAGAAQSAQLREELNQTVALVVQLQDGQAELQERLAGFSRARDVEQDRGQEDWIDLARRVDQLERQALAWQDRQASQDEMGRHFQQGLSLLRQELQQIDKRLEITEGRGARALEGANRAEHTLTEVDASILSLQREDEAIGERTRVASDMAHRLETTLNQHLHELQRVELLAERIELHRAERQRLEDRALRLEEGLTELRELATKAEDNRARLASHQQGLASRLDASQEQIEEQRAKLVDQLRRLTGSQERTKRRQVQELERELREMRQYVAELADK
jgi:chromosome segregation ATPase